VECLSYKAADECLICAERFRLVGKVCSKLNLSDCLYSYDDQTCDVCNGLRSEEDAKLCTLTKFTTTGCLSCKKENEKEVCEACSFGYVMNNSKECVETEGANLGCGVLDSSDKCVSCSYGYYVTSKDSAMPVTCAKSHLYAGVTIINELFMIMLGSFILK
jgi:hypothetical protein